MASVGVLGVCSFGGGAGAAGSGSGGHADAASTVSSSSPRSCSVNRNLATVNPKAVGVTGAFNAGTPHSSRRLYLHGCLVAYGNRAITYVAPSAARIPVGQQLFETYCSSCHGPHADGSTGRAPNLLGLGPATVDFWVSTGRMPADNLTSREAPRKPAKLTPGQALDVAAYVNSLAPATPFIPVVHTSGANLASGFSLFTLNCAACHTITGAGDALAFSTFSPTLHAATITQVAEAIRTGPANMPRFTGNLSDAQVRDIAVYVVEKIQHPANIGGWGLGGIGPVTEGFVALLFGVGLLMLVSFWVGDKS